METSADTAAIIDRSSQRRRNTSSARQLVLVTVIVGIAISAAASVRVAVVTLATPSISWLDGYAALLDPDVKISSETQRFARKVSSLISDVSLIRGLQWVCFGSEGTSGPPNEAQRKDDAACLIQVDAALRAAPASGELWLFKASMLASRGDFGEPMMNALRNSYRTSLAEGWIASERVILGLRLYPALAPDLQSFARSDLELVLRYAPLSQPLADAYASDATLRNASSAPLRELSEDALRRFVEMVQLAIRNRENR
jgi:hypothetical protein